MHQNFNSFKFFGIYLILLIKMIIIKLIKSFIYLDYKFNENFITGITGFLSHLADEF